MLLGLVVAFAGIPLASSNIGRWLEEEVGLANKPRKRPRSLHADLVRKLNKHGAAVIAFDIFFEENRDSQENTLFAAALHEANNVVLFQSMNKDPVNNETLTERNQQTGYIETLSSPIHVLEEAAFDLAPFPLPKVPAQVNHFLTFR